jgi:hypothetical protein
MRKLIITGMAVAMLAVPATSMAKDNSPAYTTDTVGSCNGGTPGEIAVSSKGIATFTLPNNSSYGVIKTFPTNLKVKDIKTLSFKSNSSAGGGMVYMNVITNGNHKIKYTPFDQAFPEPGIGSWFTHDMLTSGVRFNDANDGTPAMTWAQAVGQFGDETVNRVSITAGCSLGFGTVQVDRMQVNNSVIDFK